MADLDSTEVKQRTSDIKEWIFEAVDKIGAPMQYIRKEMGTEELPALKIEDNQVPLPADMIFLDGVAYSESENGPWVPMKTSTSIFRQPKKTKASVQPSMRYKAMTSQSQLYTMNNMKYAEKVNREQPEYFIKPGWLVTNKSDGYVKMAYKAIAVDERGYPLIPDLGSYQEAIYWYVTMKLAFPKFMSGKLGGKSKYAPKYAQNTYFFLQQQWNFYRNQAYAEAMMPTADDMQTIKSEWNKLVPEFDSSETFFKDINKQQDIYTDYYYGY